MSSARRKLSVHAVTLGVTDDLEVTTAATFEVNVRRADAEHLHTVPYLPEGLYADALRVCTHPLEGNRALDEYCPLTRLPFLGTEQGVPTVDDITPRVLSCCAPSLANVSLDPGWRRSLSRVAPEPIKADEALARKAAVFTSIPGIAAITATGLLAGIPELGRLDAKTAASLAGLAPVARESGQWKGRRFIGSGRGRVRKLLYMAALSAVQHNPDLAVVYSRLCDRGKPAKVALTAAMRKLIVLANTLLKEDREWMPSALCPSART